MTTLTNFLLARIAEDEAAARAAMAHEAALREVKPGWDFIWTWALMYNAPHGGGGHGFHPDSPSPARVMAECAAHRAIVAEHEGEHHCTRTYDPWDEHDPCPTLRALASVYADHPDFDPEWRLS